ncbi:MAG: DUF1292 domain-containing protein [Clostridia bacterium]|nr:DUF1292 domain-containing protein [Clostridia bacterium]
MAEEKKNELEAEDEGEEVTVYTLTDEDGKEYEFEIIDDVEMDGNIYFAMVPTEETESDADVWNYVILKQKFDEEGNEFLETLEDDDEFEKVAAYFDDQLSEEIDYDEEDNKD